MKENVDPTQPPKLSESRINLLRNGVKPSESDVEKGATPVSQEDQKSERKPLGEERDPERMPEPVKFLAKEIRDRLERGPERSEHFKQIFSESIEETVKLHEEIQRKTGLDCAKIKFLIPEGNDIFWENGDEEAKELIKKEWVDGCQEVVVSLLREAFKKEQSPMQKEKLIQDQKSAITKIIAIADKLGIAMVSPPYGAVFNMNMLDVPLSWKWENSTGRLYKEIFKEHGMDVVDESSRHKRFRVTFCLKIPVVKRKDEKSKISEDDVISRGILF